MAAYDQRPGPFMNAIGLGRQLAPILLGNNFTTTEMRKIARNLGVKPKGVSRNDIAKNLEAAPQAIEFAAAIGQLVDNARIIAQADEKVSGLSAKESEMLDKAMASDWRGLVWDAIYSRTPMQDVLNLYHKADVSAYGERLIIGDVTVDGVGGLDDNVYHNIPIRAKTAIPTRDELIHAIKYHAQAIDDEDGYRTRIDYKTLKYKSVDIRLTATHQNLRVLPGMDWLTRAHWLTVLNYKCITDKPTELDDLLAEDTEGKTCAYDIAAKDLGLTHDEISALVGKAISDGLTIPDMVELYKKHGKGLYCFDLNETILDKVVIPKDEQVHHGDNVFVLIFANQHVYRPTAETRAALIKKTPDKRAHKDEIETKTAKVPVECKNIMAGCFRGAMAMALPLAEEREKHNIVRIKELYASRLEQLKKAKEKRLEGFVPDRQHSKISQVKDLEDMKKLCKKAYDESLAAAYEYYKNTPPVNIYVPIDDLAIWYRLEIAATQDVYPSDINSRAAVTNMRIAPFINIYANSQYAKIKKTADDLKIPYVNQQIAALARKSFKTFRDSRDGHGWDQSLINNAINDMLINYPINAPEVTLWDFKGEDEEIAAVDFYRQYTSTARNGDFYTVPLLSDIQKYDGHAIGADPFMYYVETTDGILFQGNGLYDYKVVACGISYGIITIDDVKKQISVVPSKNIDRTLRSWIDWIYAHVSNDAHRKELVIKMIGSMAVMHKTTNKKPVITTNHAEASYYYEMMKCTDKHMRILTNTAGHTVYLVTGSDIVPKRKSDEIIRRTIIQRSRMDTFILMKQIAKEIKPNSVSFTWPEGQPRYRPVKLKTDAVYYIKDKTDIDYPTSALPTFGSLRREKVSEDMRNTILFPFTPLEVNTLKYTGLDHEWKEPLGLLSDTEWFDAKRLLPLNRAFIKGFAGAGKTVILNALMSEFEAQGLKVHATAYTHAAAHILRGGHTAHSMLGINRVGNASESKIKDLMTSADVILIDEISMIPESVYAIISQLPDSVRIFGFGDFNQYQPIEQRDKDILYCDSTMFKSLFNFNLVTLQKHGRHGGRASNECLKFYNVAARKGVVDAFNWHLPKGIVIPGKGTIYPRMNICFTNKMRRKINKEIMEIEFKDIVPFSERIHKPYERKPDRRYYIERFDARKLYHIIQHPDEFKDLLKSTREGVSQDSVVELLKKYYANSTIDEHGVGHKQTEYYKSSEGRGRWTAEGSESLINIARGIRQIIATDHYCDIDCVNCHPMILKQLCAKMGLQTKYLNQYVDKRDEVFAELAKDIKGDRDSFKKLILAVINGGEKDFNEMGAAASSWAMCFRQEMRLVGEAFMKKYPERVTEHREYRRKLKKWEGSDVGSFVNMFLIDGEVKILEVVITEMRRRGLLGVKGDDVVLCYDGIMILHNEKITQAMLNEISAAIKKQTGFDMCLLPKKMQGRDISGMVSPVKSNDLLGYIDGRLWDEFPRIGENMPIISNMNDSKELYFNNESFTIRGLKYNAETKINGTGELAYLEGSTIGADGLSVPKFIAITHERLRRDFRPAYCVTSHKIQGQTLKEAFGVHELFKMDAHGAYVCVTRATDMSNVSIF